MPLSTLIIPALTVYATLSFICVALFVRDKRAAQARSRRVPEATLHMVELLGGWPGAWLAMWFLRHKSAKHRYRLITNLIALVHIVAWVALLLVA